MMTNTALEQKISALCDNFAGTIGICAKTTEGNHSYALNSTDIYPTASVIKIFILYTLLKQNDTSALNRRITVTAQDHAMGSGALMHLDPDLTPTIKDLATLMMMISDNTATNMLINHLGLETINTAIKDAGLKNSRLGGLVDFETLSKDPADLGTATPEDFVTLLLDIRHGNLLDEDNAKLFWDIMRIQKYIDPLRKHLPCNPYAREYNLPEDVWVASKTGGLAGMRTESGLVHTPNAEWAISIMIKDMPQDINFSSLSAASALISDISLAFYEEWS